MAFYNKVKWVLGILVVFLLIVATNLIDRNNFVRVRESVETLYEDRLIANDLLFELAKTVQENEIAVHLSDTSFSENKKKKPIPIFSVLFLDMNRQNSPKKKVYCSII